VITYIDASVLLRVVQGSPDALKSWPELEPVSSNLIRVECLRSLDRARLMRGANELAIAHDRASVLDVLLRFALAPITDSILYRAADPFPTSLGSMDAIHLATALELREMYAGLILATHDQELAIAARSMGFEVTGA